MPDVDASPTATPPLTRAQRRRIGAEVWIVLGLSLGQSAVYSLVNIAARLTAGTPLAEQTATLNASRSERPLLDLTYQLLGIGFALVPVALALFLLSGRGRGALAALGVDRARPGRDVAWGVALAAAIGIPGLAFYALGRVLGITVSVQASALNEHWWTVPVLILAALKNGVLEEVIAVGYLYERTRELGWDRLRFVVASSLLRGTYHLYQGIGPFLGNVVMGLLFSWFYTSRWGRRRVVPLVVAHTLLDVVAFVGYALVPAEWRASLGIT
ncbi:CPBP family intramembrane glutamic endopeptidase [Isoptericola variabilis]|uniref:Abortive infection protein n=1 Tax=Isoptericola variabilis (strain 225) TaxID=743718 RepID=F6FVR1_ISOV2|nr:CPBP family intramembrane glutamic endopeptidase [Isoptericola variabilis]AEG45562.1 Abortive infection protein [Isoptericola variabilis 225]TWH25830.1 CAAX prenyl protease-like protein [Isoptericola variabilis J7]